MSSLVGRHLGPYRILEHIGAGGMGTVYKAYQPSMDRYVAIKVLPYQLTQDEKLLKRLQREAKAIARLEHSHILPAYDYGEHEGTTYMVMRLAEGGTLRDRIARGPLSVGEISRIIGQVGSALDYAHRMGVIHRDIKSGNILFDAQGDAFLGDFGLATMMSQHGSITPGAGTVGTVAYMSPEQGRGLPVDHRSDLYSLGVVLYEMATGRLPYEAETPVAVMLKHITEPLPAPRAVAPHVPEAVERVILKALAKSPAERYQSAAEMVEAVGAAAAEAAPMVREADFARAPRQRIDVAPTLENVPTGDLPAFIAGPPIAHPARFFGREREVKRIFGLLRQPPLQNAAVVGPRRSGKTSLLHYLKSVTCAAPEQLRPGQRAGWLPQPERYRWVFVDFQDPRLGDREELLRYLLSGFDLPAPASCTLGHFLDVVSQNLRTPTVILMDEVGVALRRYPELGNAFWEGLRSLATNQVGGNLAFVLAAHESPAQLAHRSGMGSPFFNIFGYTTTLGPLTEPEARELIGSSPIPFPPDDVEWILAQSERWPIRLQILCRERLVTLEEGEAGAGWRKDALQQMAPFAPAPSSASLPEPLSDHELEVLQLVAEGRSNQEIAQQLAIAVSTVEAHVNSLYRKLEVKDRLNAVERAQRLGLLK